MSFRHLCLLSLTITLSSRAEAAPVLATSRGDLGGPGIPGNDFADFGDIGPRGTNFITRQIASNPGGVNVDVGASGFGATVFPPNVTVPGAVDELNGESSIVATGFAQAAGLFYSAGITLQFAEPMAAAGVDVLLDEFGFAAQYNLFLDVTLTDNTTTRFPLFSSLSVTPGVLFDEFVGVRSGTGLPEILSLQFAYVAQAQSGTSGALEIAQLDVINTSRVISPVPEPVSMTLFGVGMLGLFACRRRKVDEGRQPPQPAGHSRSGQPTDQYSIVANCLPALLGRIVFVVLGTIMFIAVPSSTKGATITQTLGDVDFFGFGSGTLGIDSIPAIDVDNRTVGDPLFTDHDIREVVFGRDDQNDVAFSHDFSPFLPFMPIDTVVVELALAGIQDAAVFALGATLDDRLFFEGIEVPGAFDAVDQGAFGTDLFSFSLSPAQISSFAADGILDIFIDGGRVLPESNPFVGGSLESYLIDFSRVIVTTQASAVVPEPGSMALFGLGALGLIACRRRTPATCGLARPCRGAG